MAIEIERRFRVETDAWRALAAPGTRIEQAYVMSGPDRAARVRLREGQPARLTLKIGSGIARSEYEYEIPDDDARAMMEQHLGEVVRKTRHHLRHGGLTFEIDEFHGHLAGLVLAEIELPEIDTAFDVPDWAGTEVTDDPAYENRSLALNGMPAGHGKIAP